VADGKNRRSLGSRATDIYEPHFVERLFDDMAGTYETVNYLASFGFCDRWRRQFVEKASIRPGMVVCDLMCGMGECWPGLGRLLRGRGRILGVDFSRQMLHGAKVAR